jgi:hypothetical protein
MTATRIRSAPRRNWLAFPLVLIVLAAAGGWTRGWRRPPRLEVIPRRRQAAALCRVTSNSATSPPERVWHRTTSWPFCNIITVYDVGKADAVDFIAMEHVAGTTLDRLIGRKGLSLRAALKYACRLPTRWWRPTRQESSIGTSSWPT